MNDDVKVSFQKADFFNLVVDEKFDLIYDYTYVHLFNAKQFCRS